MHSHYTTSVKYDLPGGGYVECDGPYIVIHYEDDSDIAVGVFKSFKIVVGEDTVGILRDLASFIEQARLKSIRL